MSRKRAFVLVGCGLAWTAGGCAPSESAPTACTPEAPSTCPDAGAPSYDAEVAAIVQDYCVPCHKPGGVGENFHFGSYGGANGIKANSLAALGQVNGCLMPNTGGAPLPADDKVALLTWLVCGAPDN